MIPYDDGDAETSGHADHSNHTGSSETGIRSHRQAHSHVGAHSHTVATGPRGLITAAVLNSGFAVIQIVVGLMVGSVVVLADAAHQVVDALGLLTALAALLLTARPPDSTMSYGWGKADALGGFISGSMLIGSIIWIAYESVERLLNPADVDSSGVIAIGLAGLAINGVSVLILGGAQDVLAIRAARLHLLTDLAGSGLVLLTGLALSGTSATWLDPASSLLLCVIVVRSTKSLLVSSVSELLDRTPSDISTADVKNALLNEPGVIDVHHIHVRPLGQSRTSVTAHIVLDGSQTLHAAQESRTALSLALTAQLPVSHSTLQLECHPCADDGC